MVYLQRRKFLRQLGALPVVAGNLLSTGQAATQDYTNLPGYKALVCVFLEGGCDSHSLFLPAEAPLFSAYKRARGALAVPADEVLYVGEGQRRLGFNPALPDLADLYADSRIAVVRNLGNLAAPMTRDDYLSNRPWVPEGLFFHAAQSRLWQTASSGLTPPRLGSGWAGRMVDIMRDSNRHEDLPLAFSVATASQWLSGDSGLSLALQREGPGLLEHLDGLADKKANQAREATLDKILQLQRSHSVTQRAAQSFQYARNASRALHEVLGGEDYVTSSFIAESSLAKSLKTVARMIVEHDAFDMQRQVFFVRQPGWDTHTNQAQRLPPLMRDLNASLLAFQKVIEENSLQDSVTTFTASEFARSLSVNSSGTDHGWGGQYLVMGGAVDGGRLVGQAPGYRVNGEDDAGARGRFIPAVSNTEFGAALAGWFGLADTDLGQVFPDLSQFSNRAPLRLFR